METEVSTKDRCGGANGRRTHCQDIHENLVDPSTAARLAQTFKALSDPTRVRIISVLVGCELCVHELAAALGMTHSAISHQLGTLRDMRLVKFRKEGRHVFYTLDDEHIHDLFRQGLEHIRHE
jgi:DNA-binding transcriptional ArsR family regulator